MKIFSIIKSILSGIIWGFGQLLNKQYFKALFFFVIFVFFIGIELSTSKYFTTYEEDELAYSKLIGEDFDDIDFQNLASLHWDEINKPGSKFTGYLPFIEYMDSVGVEYNAEYLPINGTEQNINSENFIEWMAQDISNYSYERYTNIFSNQEILPDEFNSDNKSLELLLTRGTLYQDPVTLKYYYEVNVTDDDGNNKKEYVETSLLTSVEDPERITNISGFYTIIKDNQIYLYKNNYYLYFREVRIVDGFNETTNYAVNILDNSITTRPLNVSAQDPEPTLINKYTGPLYRTDGTIFHHYKIGLVHNGARQRYLETPFMPIFRRNMVNIYSSPVNQHNDEDYMRLMLKVYFELNPDVKNHYLEGFDNFFYDRAGFFTKGYWSIITLGTTQSIDYREFDTLDNVMVKGTGLETGQDIVNTTLKNHVNIDNRIITMGGHITTFLLLEGLIAVILSAFFFIFMIWSIKDAYKVSEQKRKEKEVLNDKAYFKEIWTKGFEYIILSPAIFVLAFISIMPIIYGFVIAFTSIRGNASLNSVFDWVGFKNFVDLFGFTSGFGDAFSAAFWRVLWWTIIWAVFSTLTVFFGGFLQALILNSEKVVFRKFWRTILILPWAIPALLSQMVFSVIFSEGGVLNQFLSKVGIYDFLINLGVLGNTYEATTGIAKNFYLGNENIVWLQNAHNPTFVRIVLIVINIWLGFPYFMALMTGIMTAIDKTLYEAADIDGATGFQKIRHITLPLMLYSTAPILIMTFSGNFNNFGVIYFITGGGANAGGSRGYAGDTDILISWMYKLTVDYSIYNLASVFSVLIFIFVGSITAWNLSRTRAFQED